MRVLSNRLRLLYTVAFHICLHNLAPIQMSCSSKRIRPHGAISTRFYSCKLFEICKFTLKPKHVLENPPQISCLFTGQCSRGAYNINERRNFALCRRTSKGQN